MKTHLVIALTAALLLCWAPASFALDAAGTYSFREKGYKGTMVIKRMGQGFTFTFKTQDLRNAQMCDFTTFETPIDQGGGRTDDTLPAHGGTKDDGIAFAIAFSGTTATVTVDSKGGECGMSGYFGGKYVKTSK